MGFVSLTEGDDGHKSLVLKGGFNSKVDEALRDLSWDRLVLFGVEWEDYQPLVKHSDKIKWLAVPLGPDSSVGLNELKSVEKLEMGDSLSPPVDFRGWSSLRDLKILMGSCYPLEFVACPDLYELDIEGFPDLDLKSLKGAQSLEKLRVSKGRLKSLCGLDKLSGLEELRLFNLRSLLDISDLTVSYRIKKLELEGISKLEDVSPVFEVESLEECSLDVKNASLESSSVFKKLPNLVKIQSDVIVSFLNWRDFCSSSLRSLVVKFDNATVSDQMEIRTIFEEEGMNVIACEIFSSKTYMCCIEFDAKEY